MKDLSGAVVLFFMLLFVYTKWVGPIPFSVNSVSTQKTDTFTVTGEGKVEISPDVAVVNAGVTASASSVKLAQAELNKKMNAITGAIKKLGIAAADMKTTNYNIYPSYDYQSGTQKLTGYTSSSNLTIKVREIDKSSEVIDGATAAGANQVSGVDFQIDDPAKAENAAREMAVKEAKQKAEAAARSAGFTLGRVVNYSESAGGDYPRPLLTRSDMVLEKAGTPTQVEPGLNEIRIQISLSYEVK